MGTVGLQRRSRTAAPRAVCSFALGEAEDGGERLVDAPHLGGSEVADALAQSLRVDWAELLDEHSGGLAGDFDLGPKRCPIACSALSSELPSRTI